MDPFATVEDLERRWRALTPSETDRAEVLLKDASAFLMAEFEKCGRAIDLEDELLVTNLRVVCCAMVKRMLASSVDAEVTQMSQTAGPFTEQFTFANPTNDLYLRDQERRILGITKHHLKMGFIMPGSRPYEG